MEDGRAEGWSALGDGGRAAMSLMPDAVRTRIRVCESSQLERLVGNLTVVGQPMCFSALWDVTVSQSSSLDGEREAAHHPSASHLLLPLGLCLPLGELTPLYNQLPHATPSLSDRSQPLGPAVSISSLSLSLSLFFAESIKLKLQYFGHLMQRADSLEETLMLGKIEGRKRRG